MPPEEKKERIPIKSLRTYQGDVEEAIANNKYTSTTILVAEQKRRVEEPQKVVEVKYSGTRNRVFIYFGGLFFILGVAIVTSVYYIKSSDDVVIERQVKTFLSPTKEIKIALASSTEDNIISTIVKERENFKLPINSVLYVNTVNENVPVDTSKILSVLAPSAPSSLVRSFDNKYMLGIYSYDTNEVFLILSVDDYASSYSGMLKWEKDMPKDLAKIFSVDQDFLTRTYSFSDLSIKNKDLRIIRDDAGKTIMLYSFIDKETLLITKNEKIFGAILARINISKQAK